MTHWYLLKALRSRLSQRITLWVFCSLMAIEAVILVPSYLRREREQLDHLNLLAKTSVTTAIQDSTTIDSLMAAKLFQHLKAENLILGGAIYFPDGQLVIGYSQYPDAQSFQILQAAEGTYYNRAGHTYDVAVQALAEDDSPLIVIRYDAIPVRNDLYAYAGRMISMIVLISLVVTIGTMVGVERLVIRPVLYLQNDLITAGHSLAENIRHPAFKANLLKCPDELGKVILAFQTLYEQVWQATQQQEVSLILEQQERDRANQLTETLDQLHQTQAQLVQVEKMAGLGQLAAGMAHEINNPVTFIHSNIYQIENYFQDLLTILKAYQQAYPSPPSDIQDLEEDLDLAFLKKDYLKIVDSFWSGTERIQTIIKALKNFARLDESGVKTVNLQDCIVSTLILLKNRLSANHQRPEIKIIQTYQTSTTVTCQPALINQVLLNIITNAIEAIDRTPPVDETPYIGIDVKQSENHWIHIQIYNNGPTLSEKDQHKLFDPFFTTKPVGEGTGISLFSSYQIIHQQHGGNLQCISAPGEKVTFLIELPLSQCEKLVQEKTAPAESR